MYEDELVDQVPQGDWEVIMRTIHRVAANPTVYDWIQRLAGYRVVASRISACLGSEMTSVLDVGAGTGALYELLDSDTSYIWLDEDPQKLGGFRSRVEAGCNAVLGDATRIGLQGRVVDYVVCVNVAHHLSDRGFARMVRELARVARKQVLFLDPVVKLRSPLSRILWALDRGSNPRTEDSLLRFLGESIELQRIERFTVYHSYLLCVGRPKSPASFRTLSV